MSAQKYSYKPADAAAASTVVLLKDGNLLEVRRGGKTTWGPGEERTRWASLSAWMESLPVGASITKSGASHVPLSPELKRVVDGLKTTRGSMRGGLYFTSSSECDKKRLQRHINWLRAMITIHPGYSGYHTQLAQVEAQFAAIPNTPKTYSVDLCNTMKTPILYCKAADGGLRRVWFSVGLGLFGVRDGSQVRAAVTLAELGFPANTEMWGRRWGEQDLVKL